MNTAGIRPRIVRRISLSFRSRAGIARRDHGSIPPQPLELIKLPQLGMKHVDHEVYVIEQHPATLREAFHMMRLEPRGRECRQEMLRHAAHMRVRRSRRDDEI